MPAGFGYGMIGGAVRAALARGGSYMGGVSTKLGAGPVASMGWGRAIGSDLARYAGQGLNRLSTASNVTLSMTGGAVAGGIYGGMSDNMSVMGGALRGAGLGYMGVRGAKMGLDAYRVGFRGAYRGGMGMGQSLSAGFSALGRSARTQFGSDYTKAYNGIRGMYGSASSYVKGAYAGFRGR